MGIAFGLETGVEQGLMGGGDGLVGRAGVPRAEAERIAGAVDADVARPAHANRRGQRPSDDALGAKRRGQRVFVANAVLQAEDREVLRTRRDRAQLGDGGGGVITLDGENGEVKGRAGPGLGERPRGGHGADAVIAVFVGQLQPIGGDGGGKARASDQRHRLARLGQFAAHQAANRARADDQDVHSRRRVSRS